MCQSVKIQKPQTNRKKKPKLNKTRNNPSLQILKKITSHMKWVSWSWYHFCLKTPEYVCAYWLLWQEGLWGADSWGWNRRCFPVELHPRKAAASQQGTWGKGGILPGIVALLTPVSTRVRTEASPVTSTDQKKVKSEATTILGLILVAQPRTNMTGTSLLSFFFFF